jgi:hypothetical protein
MRARLVGMPNEMTAVDLHPMRIPTAHVEATTIFASSLPLPDIPMRMTRGEQTMTAVHRTSRPAATVVVGAVVAEMSMEEGKPEVPAAAARDRDPHRGHPRNTLPIGTNNKALQNGSSDQNMAAITLLDLPAIATPAVLRPRHMRHRTAISIIRTILITLTTHTILSTITRLLLILPAWATFRHDPTAAHPEVSTLQHPQVTRSATVHLLMAWSTTSWEVTLHKVVRWRLAARRPGPSRFAILKGC